MGAVEKTNPEAVFKRHVTRSAQSLLVEWVGEERAQEAIGRVVSAFAASMLSAKNKADFYECTPASIAQAVAVSALTGIMPSTGQAALAYLIPRRPRKGERPLLSYQLSHRGLAALARRAGLSVVAVPVGTSDTLEIDLGAVVRCTQDPDNPPASWEDLRGVLVVVRDVATANVVHVGFMAKKLVDIRRQTSDSFRFAEKQNWAKKNSPWHKWPVEQAMKTAMHYAIERGWAVVDDTEAVRALSVDGAGDVLEDFSANVSMQAAEYTDPGQIEGVYLTPDPSEAQPAPALPEHPEEPPAEKPKTKTKRAARQPKTDADGQASMEGMP